MSFKEARTIKREDLKRYSLEVLNMLEREKIGSISELEEKMGESFPTPEGIIQLESRPSESGSIASTISYIIEGKGIPIEIRLNPEHHYSLFIVKAEEELADYNPEFSDPLGNIIQDKRIESSFEKALEELKRLSVL